MAELIHLAITMGDPAGIGPEIILKALEDPLINDYCQITVIGSLEQLKNVYQKLQGQVKMAEPDSLSVWDMPVGTKIESGVGSPATGAASFAYLETAINATLEGRFQGIVTAPIAKSLWKAAGYDYPGQTEVLANYAGVEKSGMLFVGRSPHTGWILRTLLATTHIPLSQVPQALNPELMTIKLDLLVECLKQDFGISQPEIAIAGLNPHSGEKGQLGKEEQEWLIPWLQQATENHPNITLRGPVPPDTLWVKPGEAWYQKELNSKGCDGYLALYHDQGLIPVKLMAFDQAINTTIGLPFVRTSPDHGTAFDIAGTGVAKANSIKEAIYWAAHLAKQRNHSINP